MSDIKKLMAAHHEKLLAACVEYRAKLDELERENAALQQLVADPNAMHAHYLRHLPGWEVWSTERIRNMDRDNARLELENAALRAEVKQLKGALALGQQNCDDAYNDLREERDEAKTENAVLRADKERLDFGCIIVREMDEMGNFVPVLHKGINLRTAIDAARKEENS